MKLQYDGTIALATGTSRFATVWKNQSAVYSKLLEALSRSKETPETLAEYMSKSKDEQDKIKDIGGFVGGHLREGKRQNGCVECRQLITLDADTPPDDFPEYLRATPYLSFAWALYSTHKHGPGRERYRLIIPLVEPVSPDEYEAIARKVAEHIGIDYFDDSTYQPTRLMYFPSHPRDIEPVFEYQDAHWLHPQVVLAEYSGHWDDTSYWPESSRSTGIRKAITTKQQDPTTKDGIVGAFCRTYDVPAAIDKFLSDIYIPAKGGRYTYAKGSSSGGLAIYQDGLFAYSNHSTDPASGKCCNSFDLCRIHLFGDRDDMLGPHRQLKSFDAMSEFASKDPEVARTLAEDTRRSAVLDFKDIELPDEEGISTATGSPSSPSGSGGNTGGGGNGRGASTGSRKPDMGWETLLTRGKNGQIKPDITNAVLILSRHPALQGIKYNELSHAIEVQGELPWNRPDKHWRNADFSQLYAWVADQYGVQFSDTRFDKALAVAVDRRRFNPIRDYLENLPPWDGTERVDRLLIDYLNAEDSQYVRAATRVTLVGAVKRVFEPGCQHDTVLVLNGEQGQKKSTLIAKLGGEYSSDSLRLTDMRDKTAAEKLQGVWLMELAEMQGWRKADAESVKGFITCRIDRYRPSYGKVVEHFPRSAVLFGTTNRGQAGFLRDVTGNRRFLPVNVNWGAAKSVDDLTPEEIGQIWAEALVAYRSGENNYLAPDMEIEAAKVQQAALEHDEREGIVELYLETPIPDDFYTWEVGKRAEYFQMPELFETEHKKATKKREYVSAMEIWVECFGKPLNRWEAKNGFEIAAIMACIPGWAKTGARRRIEAYGQQRVYERIKDGERRSTSRPGVAAPRTY